MARPPTHLLGHELALIVAVVTEVHQRRVEVWSNRWLSLLVDEVSVFIAQNDAAAHQLSLAHAALVEGELGLGNRHGHLRDHVAHRYVEQVPADRSS